MQSAGPSRAPHLHSAYCATAWWTYLPTKLALGHVPRTTSQPPAALSKPEGCRGSHTRWLKSTKVSTGYCTAASLPLPRVSLYLPCRLTAAQCSAAAVCAARLRSLYGAQQIPTGRYCKGGTCCSGPAGVVSSRVLYFIPPPGYPGCPGLSWTTDAAVSPRCLSPFPFPTVVGRSKKRERTACMACMACLEAATYWNPRTLLSPSFHTCGHHHHRQHRWAPAERKGQPTRGWLIHFSPGCLPACLMMTGLVGGTLSLILHTTPQCGGLTLLAFPQAPMSLPGF